MPFGLKNAEATYQRIMDKVFKNLIDQSVDDIFIKSKKTDEIISDLKDTFSTICT